MRLGVLTSGGKDSLYAAYLLAEEHRIEGLLTMIPEGSGSYMFHHPNTHLTALQAEALGVPRWVEETEGVKEEELVDLERLLSRVKGEVDGIVTGAIASTYQRSRVERICHKIGLQVLSPLWSRDPSQLWWELLGAGFQVIVTSVSAEGLDASWLGRQIDSPALEELLRLAARHRFNPAFEGGEAETLVLDMPLFRKRIALKKAERLWDGIRGEYLISEALLVGKEG
jgi:ABC transporter with metal-binding/Fe-S-binding domain ATP-binding protein